jgi:ABC-2 type transport system permease protein
VGEGDGGPPVTSIPVATNAPPRSQPLDLLWTLVERGLLLRQKRSAIGLFWPVTAPIVMLILYNFVFHRVFVTPIRSYPTYLFCGLLPWTLFTQGTANAQSSITGSADVIRRAPFPYYILPLSSVLSSFLPFAILLVGFTAWIGVFGNLELVLLPLLVLPIVALILITSAAAMLLSLIDVYNHSMRFLLGNVLSCWFFLVPIVYRPDMAGRIGDVLRSIDPINMIVGQFRDILYWGNINKPGQLVLMVGLTALCFVVSLAIFVRVAPEIPKEL